ncbi:MAG TPA: hypothetical protein DEG17_26805 [Cyanobacteria bacterium UBA11149]|nr:hypothetical protein [Cyanobacteria bacterium UBA11367]HBE56584.1 hypothetical protein [Cyanobacteria bacterium UBA11366]HBK65294.1 hypothetical protein [Cyanobacteria bacterium UBA11166]HBR75178.1 hypothetical protein [Cyanobacteria bacterium UBA11159]HBS72151.1 hypothetical protein [Cyanobacteria bacterium UBA11153]HBW92377.1 hypothetical protein [Cyanobacteria bacterium UBA11149]HCA93267.1 hypothetical protein [Cyanobacteria bacterium UBA9226]
MSLSNLLGDAKKKDTLVADLAKLIDTQVASMGGVSGLALKAGYSAIKGISPGYITKVLEHLLPEALVVLDPLWSEGVQSGDPVDYFSNNKSRVSDSLLGITDARIEKSNNKTVTAIYGKLRKSVNKHVEDAVPGLAKVILKAQE